MKHIKIYCSVILVLIGSILIVNPLRSADNLSAIPFSFHHINASDIYTTTQSFLAALQHENRHEIQAHLSRMISIHTIDTKTISDSANSYKTNFSVFKQHLALWTGHNISSLFNTHETDITITEYQIMKNFEATKNIYWNRNAESLHSDDIIYYLYVLVTYEITSENQTVSLRSVFETDIVPEGNEYRIIGFIKTTHYSLPFYKQPDYSVLKIKKLLF